MITLPEVGFRRSVKIHNVDLISLCDWIESSVAFDQHNDRVSKTDVIDVLCENNVYGEQDFAAQLVDDAWTMLRTRQRWLHPAAPFLVEHKHIRRTVTSWSTSPAHSFCIMLSLALLHKAWAEQFGADYTMQGHLFERLTCASLRALGWNVVRTGWSGDASDKIATVIQKVSDHLREPANPRAFDYVSKWDNEAGLDVVCSRRFIDHETRPGGVPVCLMQCASGGDWPKKLHTPDIEQWKRIVTFSTSPVRGISVPFQLHDNKFLPTCAKVSGIVFDRYRILSAAASKPRWVPQKLAADLVQWLSPRVSCLPYA